MFARPCCRDEEDSVKGLSASRGGGAQPLNTKIQWNMYGDASTRKKKASQGRDQNLETRIRTVVYVDCWEDLSSKVSI